jgi:large subunit ribosomal protein L18
MTNKNTISRERRHRRVRSKISGTEQTPRISVYRSNASIFVQAIDDTNNKTVASVSDKKLKGTKSEKSLEVGKALAETLLKMKIEKGVFDRGGFKYHGRVAKVAEGLRSANFKI